VPACRSASLSLTSDGFDPSSSAIPLCTERTDCVPGLWVRHLRAAANHSSVSDGRESSPGVLTPPPYSATHPGDPPSRPRFGDPRQRGTASPCSVDNRCYKISARCSRKPLSCSIRRLYARCRRLPTRSQFERILPITVHTTESVTPGRPIASATVWSLASMCASQSRRRLLGIAARSRP
jgi:hypothetical protein